MHTRINFDSLIKLNISIPLELKLNDFDGRLHSASNGTFQATAETRKDRSLLPYLRGLTSYEVSAGFLLFT